VDGENQVDDGAPSGMPEGEPELTPMGVDEDDGSDERGSNAMPGIPTEGEPDVSG
jgi:hypothetical protein